MRIFLTGATGFVGSHVARALAVEGHAVRALRRAPRPGTDDLPVEWGEGDVLDPPSLRRGVEGCEAAIHAAASLSFFSGPDGREHQRRVNVEGTRNVVDALIGAGGRRLVFTSSVAAIGRPAPGTIADE